MSNELTKFSGTSLLRNIQDPMAAVEKLGRMFAQSGMFGLKTPEQGAIFAMTCLMEGKTPMEIMRTYHIIQGRPSMRADAMQAEFQCAGGRVRWDKSDEKICTITLTHPEYAPNGVEVTVTREEFEKSGLIKGKDNWKNFPKRMLQCRAISAGIRQLMPQIVAGIYTPEETADFVDAEFEPAQEQKPEPPKSTTAGNLEMYRNKAIGEFKILGISRDRLEAKFGESSTWGKADLKKLRSIADGIKDGSTTANAQFPQTKWSASDVASIVAKFAPYGVIQSDLEYWIGATYEPPQMAKPAAKWTKDDYAKLDWASGELIEAEDPMAKAREMFCLEPGAQG